MSSCCLLEHSRGSSLLGWWPLWTHPHRSSQHHQCMWMWWCLPSGLDWNGNRGSMEWSSGRSLVLFRCHERLRCFSFRCRCLWVSIGIGLGWRCGSIHTSGSRVAGRHGWSSSRHLQRSVRACSHSSNVCHSYWWEVLWGMGERGGEERRGEMKGGGREGKGGKGGKEKGGREGGEERRKGGREEGGKGKERREREGEGDYFD